MRDCWTQAARFRSQLTLVVVAGLFSAGLFVAVPEASAAAVDGGSTVPTAVALDPGRYTDTLPGGDRQGSSRYYRVDVADGVALHVVATVPVLEGDGGQNLGVTLFSPTGTRCDGGEDVSAQDGDPTLTAGAHPPAASAGADGCGAPGEVVVQVRREGDRDAGQALPVDLLVRLQPQLTDTADAPDGEQEQVSPQVGGETVDVTGADSWVRAPVLAPGTYVDEITPGATRVYAVTVGWGQRPAFTVQAAGRPGGTRLRATMTNPVQQDVTLRGTTEGDGALSASAVTGVRPQNVDAGGERAALDVAGTYYLSLRLTGGADDVGAVALGLQLDAVGTALDAPRVVGAAPATAEEAVPVEAAPSRGSSVPGWAGAGVLAVVGVGLLVLARRRRS